MYPDFIGIGAQKAGTTWLYRNLQAHPGVWMPPIKELHYFDEKVELEGGFVSRMRGDRPADKRWRRQVRTLLRRPLEVVSSGELPWDLRYFLGTPGDRWYASLFGPSEGKVAGELTPDYAILDKQRVARVHALMPEARIVFMMRNPLERPWSAANMGLRIRGKTPEDVTVKSFRRQLRSKRVRRMTDYLRTLDTWGAFYPEERIFVGFLEDVHFFPEETLRGLYRFLGIDPSVAGAVIREKVHTGSVEEMPARLAVSLARTYQEDARLLEERFGGYASFWRFCAERLAERPPEGAAGRTVKYPLWESGLWERWEGSGNISPQSGPLSTLRDAS